jgi:hypothetical protein
MKHGQCPKCEQDLDPFSSELFMFPFSFFCNHCKVKLKLTDWRALCFIFFGYLALMALLMTTVPIVNTYGLSVIFGVTGYFIIFYLTSGYVLHKDNLASLPTKKPSN